jgi:transcriptional regulator with XRE-family HTH domain
MLTATAKLLPKGATIRLMGRFTDETTGHRIAWARRRRGMTQAELARRVGVRNVYISQIENDHRPPSRRTLRVIADELDTTVGFLEREIDDPTPAKATEQEPVYFSPEADAAAQLIDAAPPDERARMLAVLRTLAATVSQTGQQKEYDESHLIAPQQRRLILGKHLGQQREGTRA